jgi:AcrR family transcriptional regulator
LADSRDKILTEAIALFLSEGIEGFSMRKLGARVGVTAAALYRHFKSKEDLLNQIMLGGVGSFDDYLRPALQAGTTEERLRRGAEAFLRFGLEQPAQYEVFFLRREYSELLQLNKELEAQNRKAFRILVDCVRDAMNEGHFAPGDPAAVALTILAHCHGLMSMYILGKIRLDRAAFTTVFLASLDQVIRGLRSRADRTS